MRRERPTLVHCIALRAVIAGGLAAKVMSVPGLILAPTGLGYLWVRHTPLAQCVRSLLRIAISVFLNTRRTKFLFENPDDARALGLDPDKTNKVTLVRGAGVDPLAFPAQPYRTGPGLRLALVARMIGSKRVEDAVAAVQLAQAAGHAVTLDIYGAPDPENPDSLSETQLRAWSLKPGISWHGPTKDVVTVWRESDAALLLSLGEGLPRSLVEAMACARAIITTDAPGNRLVVEDGVNGFLVSPHTPEQAALAIGKMADDKQRVWHMGEASRQRFESGFTSEAVNSAVIALYRRSLAR